MLAFAFETLLLPWFFPRAPSLLVELTMSHSRACVKALGHIFGRHNLDGQFQNTSSTPRMVNPSMVVASLLLVPSYIYALGQC